MKKSKHPQDWLPLDHLEISVLAEMKMRANGITTVGDVRALLAEDKLATVGLAAKRHAKAIEGALRLPATAQTRKARDRARSGGFKQAGLNEAILGGGRSVSLDAPIFADNERARLDALVDDSPSAEDVLVDASEGDARVGALWAAIARLPPRTRAIVEQRAADVTLREISEHTGLTREGVRQIEIKARLKLRVEIGRCLDKT